MEDQELATGLARIEAGLLEGDADPPADAVGVRGDVDAGHLGAACRDREQRRQHPDGGRLAGPVGAEEAEDLTGPDLQVHAADGLDGLVLAAVVVLHQALGEDRRRAYFAQSRLLFDYCRVHHGTQTAKAPVTHRRAAVEAARLPG